MSIFHEQLAHCFLEDLAPRFQSKYTSVVPQHAVPQCPQYAVQYAAKDPSSAGTAVDCLRRLFTTKSTQLIVIQLHLQSFHSVI